jgi:myosin-5
MELNARVWARSSKEGEWFRATVHAIERKESKAGKPFAIFNVIDENNGCATDITTEAVGTSSVEYEWVKLQNEADAGAVDIRDLTSLQNLHEPAILNALRERYMSDIIYTNTGPILIAINPYKRLDVYSAAEIENYRKSEADDDTAPHVFKVANTAFKNLEASQFTGFQNQCILVSGESGAGKTETTKFIMRYLAEITKVSDRDGEVRIEDRILQSNSVLESFGNAKTLRNDNSSRFGKFIEISFAPSNGQLRICGSVIRTYLLEKVRLIQQNVGERNYHCFYEFLSGATEEQRATNGLSDMVWNDFCYLMKNDTEFRDDDVEDEQQFADMTNALTDLNFTGEDVEGIFSVLSAILHLGNITFVPTIGTGEDEDGSAVDPASALHLGWCCRLLGFTEEAFSGVLCNKRLRTTDGDLIKKLTVAEADAARDAFSKAIYGTLFDFIVDRINKSIAVVANGSSSSVSTITKKNARTPSKTASSSSKASTMGNIGLLDIFGFESFDTNSFEQLCINYTNETLQQHFNQFVFTHEQALYEKEGISWSFIQFPDNSDILKLLEDKKGIFSLCDDQVLFPQASDDTLVHKLYDNCSDHNRFTVNNKERARGQFTIEHYAGKVTYSSKGFLEKNRDTVRFDMVQIIEDSSLKLVRILSGFMRGEGAKKDQQQTKSGSNNISPVQVKRGNKSKICSLGAEFRLQLGDLIGGISKTAPHYIRCLKPNDCHEHSHFQPDLIVHQLRYGGVLEAVRVTRAGFPNRYSFEEFCKRYSLLSPASAKAPDAGTWKDKAAPLVARLVTFALSDPKEYTPSDDSIGHANDSIRAGVQCGKTQVFLRSRLFDFLEKHRLLTQRRAATLIKAVVRGRIARKAYLQKKAASNTVSRAFRCYAARVAVQALRRARAVLLIQCAARQMLARGTVTRRRSAIALIQFGYVTYRVAKRVHTRKINRRSCLIVAFIRGSIQCKKFSSLRRGAVAAQCLWRRRSSVRRVRQLRVEMKSLKGVQGERDVLIAKLAEMQAAMERQKNAPAALPTVVDMPAPLTPKQQEEADRGESPDAIHSPIVQRGSGSPYKAMSPSIVYVKRLSLDMDQEAPLSPAPDVVNILANISSLKDQLSSVEVKYRSSCESVYWLSHSVSELLNISVMDVASKLGLDSDYMLQRMGDADSNIKPDFLAEFNKLALDRVSISLPPSPVVAAEVFCQSTETSTESAEAPGPAPDLETVVDCIERGDCAGLVAAVGRAPRLLKGTLRGWTPLLLACKQDSLELCEAMYQLNADVNQISSDGLALAPLHVAKSLAVVNLLLGDGANPNCLNSIGVSPLGRFVLTSDVECVEALLAAGADPSLGRMESISVCNPLRYCVMKGDYAMLSMLLSPAPAGALARPAVDFKQRDETGETLLHAALRSFKASTVSDKCIMLLLNSDPSLAKSCDNHGTSPLHVLCGSTAIRSEDCFEPLLEILLMFGADPNAKDVDGCTPLVIAAAYRDWFSCQMLLEQGADMNIPCLMSSRTLRSNSDSWKLSDCGVELPDTGSLECTASDLFTPGSRAKLFQFISAWQSRIAPHSRDRCMNCAAAFQEKKLAKQSCLHCGRIVCGSCTAPTNQKSNIDMPTFLASAPGASGQPFCQTCCNSLS